MDVFCPIIRFLFGGVKRVGDEAKGLIATVTGAAAPLTYGFESPNVMVDCPSNL